MNVLGVDVSTRRIACAWLEFDSDVAKVQVYDATDCDGDALVRARTLADLFPGRRSSAWDETALVAIERPMGAGTRQVADMMLVAGVVVGCLPPRVAIWLLGPPEWRKACGLPGNASKDDVARFATALRPEAYTWTQDECDALCIAYAARAINEQGQKAA